jgi:hypothetical protein
MAAGEPGHEGPQRVGCHCTMTARTHTPLGAGAAGDPRGDQHDRSARHERDQAQGRPGESSAVGPVRRAAANDSCPDKEGTAS